MSVTEKDITKIARLSRIKIADEQKPELAKKLGSILDWMENLNEVNTENVAPIFNVHQMDLKMTKDEVKDGNITEEVLKNAPDAKYNYFTVPKMIE
ncbi:MAG: glutamyl-tRNA(Gln) amidotransferase, subunit [Rickettsiaceae bacterium]|jgi:aspartyl-tRNA(Asn)/glutamyl-tRNA(Gln) amidotransferase subunit C|nr:glutamyl-tRNA(Gln) amidotransferase, subunit [Rickettsiaceae bacterium]